MSAAIETQDLLRTFRVRRSKQSPSGAPGVALDGGALLPVREQLWMFSQFYGIPTGEALSRIDRLLQVVGLFEERHRKVQQLSTGRRQKMNLVRGPGSGPRARLS